MLRKIYLLLLIITGVFGWGQTNQIILNASDNSPLKDNIPFCDGQSFNLKVNAQATSTGDYSISKDLPTSYNITAGTTPIKFSATGSNLDKFSQPINIGFPFSFYGQTYTQVVAGINGRLVFTNSNILQNLSDNTIYKDNVYSGVTNKVTGAAITPLYQLPSANYNQVYLNNANSVDLAQIFFGFTDCYHTANTSTYYYYKNVNIGGVPGLLISYQGVIHGDINGFSGKAFDSYVILLQDGRILIYINNKLESSYNALLGIQNEMGTKKQVPDHSNAAFNYNNAKWTSEGVVWIFTPNQNLTPKIEWLVNGVLKSTDTNFNYEPKNDNEQLKAVIKYFDDSGQQVGNPEESTINFNKILPVDFDYSFTNNRCSIENRLAVKNPNDNLTYTWYLNNAEIGNGKSIPINQSGKYYVIANGCLASKIEKNISIQSSLLPGFTFDKEEKFPECGTAGSYTFDLQALTKYPLDAAKYIVNFVGISGSKITLNSGDRKTITLKVTTLDGSCSDERNFEIAYQSFPANASISTKLCFGTKQYSITDFKNDFPNYANYDISFSLDGTNFSTNDVNTTQPIKVKLSKQGFDCFAILDLKFDFHPEIIVKAFTQFPEHCFSSTEYFDLNVTKGQLEYDDVKAEFYAGYDAATNTFANQITNLNFRPKGINKVYVKLFNSHGCVYRETPPTLDLIIYSPPKLIKNTPEEKKSSCGSNIFNLTTNIADYIGQWSHYSEIRYFDGNNKRLSQSEWENYNPDMSGQPYMIFVYNSTDNLECSNRVEFNLVKLPKPTSIKTSIGVCNETSYSLANFKNEVAGNNYRFLNPDNTEMITDFFWTSLPHTVEFYLMDKATGCKSELQSVSFIAGSPTLVLNNGKATLEKCDDNFDGITTFNLNDVKTKITTDASAVFKYYSDAARTQEIQANFTNTTSFAQTIYGTVTSASFCPTNFEIILTVNTPTKSNNIQPKYLICYGDTVSVDAGTENVKWEWSDGQTGQIATFTKAGSYSVKLTNAKGCSYTVNFIISDENQPKIQKINQTNDKIEVIANGGIMPYQYSFDGGATWKASNIYLNPTASSYTVQVRSTNGCLGAPKTLYTIVVNNIITPNGDGKNDTWTINNLDKMENVEILIADRYGKTVFHSTDGEKAWDGTLNGRPLPTATYWFVVKWFDPATQKSEVRQGWILLKNRD